MRFKVYCMDQCSFTLDDDFSQITGERLFINDTIFRDARYEMHKDKMQCIRENTKEDEDEEEDDVIIDNHDDFA